MGMTGTQLQRTATGTSSPGAWRQDPNTGVWGLAAGTDPNLPVDTTSEAVKPLQIPEYQQSVNVGDPGWTLGKDPSAPDYSGLTKEQTLSSSLDPIAFIRQYQATHAASPQAVQDLFTQLQNTYGINRFSYNGTLSNNEIDWNGKRKVYSEGGNYWYDPDGLSDDGGGSGGGGGAPAVAPISYGGPATMPTTQSPYSPALQQAILALLNTPQTVDADSLRKSPEFRAKALGEQRAEERQRAQLAEEAAGGGWSASGGFNTRLAGLRQQRGENESDFLGQLAVSKMQENRERLLAGIQAATQIGQFDQAQALQLELANLDAAIRRETLAQQGSQFGQQLGFNYTALQENANQAATRALLGL